MSTGKKHHVCYIEIPADDLNRSRKFYSELFDWEFLPDNKEVEGSPSEDYLKIAPRETRTSPENPHHFLGGLLRRQYPNQSITIFIDVTSVEEYCSKVQNLGGTVHKGKTAVSGWGYFAVCEDTEKNAFALWEENKSAT